MPYRLIKGDFHIFYPDKPRTGPEPDGDTLKFLPDAPELLEQVTDSAWPGPRLNSRGMINIRFEGIDSLETHFSGMHQDIELAREARDRLLHETGFRNIKFWEDKPDKVESVEQHPQRGYILANAYDTHGRIIAFVYSGNTATTDGASVFLKQSLMKKSLNAWMLKQGQAYPAFYTGLPVDLRNALSDLVARAWRYQRGLWPSDTANPEYWAWIPNLATIQLIAMWPKLFRRLVRYYSDGHSHLSGFKDWLREDVIERDDRILLPNQEFGNMHDVFDISGEWLQMIYWPEQLVILPDQA